MTPRPTHALALVLLACAPTPPAGDASSSSGGETTQTTSETTSTTGPCDDDPACGPDEDAASCPAQCNVCGDAVVFGPEVCDNGDANQTYWPDGPPQGACSETCDRSFRRCGDAVVDPDEACDNGQNSDPVHTLAPPAQGACAPLSGAIRRGHDRRPRARRGR
jgi:hypothetical protein